MEYKQFVLTMDILDDPTTDQFMLHFERIEKPVKIINKKLKWKIFSRSDEYIADAIGYPGYGQFLQAYPKPLYRYKAGTYLSDIPLWNCKLQDDYHIPDLFKEAECQPKDWRWLFWGPPEAGTNIHTDVDHSEAWNISLKGYKYWWFWYEDKLINTIQGPGDIIYTPRDVPHGVRNLTTSLAITHNYKRKGKKSWGSTWFY